MKNLLYILATGLALGALITFLMMRSCSSPQPPQIIETTTIEFLPGDPVPVPFPVPKPYPVKSIPETIPANVDSLAIIAHYFTINIYDQILKDDSSAFIRLIDTVHNNLLQGRRLDFQNRRQTAIINHTTTTILPDPQPATSIFLGPGIAVTDSTAGFTFSALLKHRNTAYQYDYHPRLRLHEVKILFNIKPRKNLNKGQNQGYNKPKKYLSFMPFP